MRSILFAFPQVVIFVLSLWGLAQMVNNTDPDMPYNVAVVLLLIFICTTCLFSLISWRVIRRLWRENRFMMSLRHGMWAGLFLISLPVLNWLEILSVVVIGAVLLVILGMESLIVLQQDQGYNDLDA